jgi:hypothetical protein
MTMQAQWVQMAVGTDEWQQMWLYFSFNFFFNLGSKPKVMRMHITVHYTFDSQN